MQPAHTHLLSSGLGLSSLNEARLVLVEHAKALGHDHAHLLGVAGHSPEALQDNRTRQQQADSKMSRSAGKFQKGSERTP
jgi:hypothetical protein